MVDCFRNYGWIIALIINCHLISAFIAVSVFRFPLGNKNRIQDINEFSSASSQNPSTAYITPDSG